MNFVLRVVVALLLTVQVLSFNCNRDETQCDNGSSCDQNTGMCDCMTGTSGTSGYDCSVITANINTGSCGADGSVCQNGGTCHDVSGNATCLCTEEYLDQNCTTPRYNLICEATNMTLEVIPFVPNFMGSVIVEGAPQCVATDEGDGLRKLTVDHTDAQCGDAVNDTERGTFTRCFYIMYNNNTFTSRDQKICAICGGSDTVVKSTGNLTITNLDAQLDDRVIGNSPLDTDVGMKLTRNDTEVSGNVVLGEELTVTGYLTSTGDKRFNAIRMESCQATNTKAPGDAQYNSQMLIENGCKNTNLNIFTAGPTRAADGLNVTFSFSAFRFIYGTTVSIACTIKTCRRASDCAPLECTPGENPATGVGRKKRQAEESEEKILSTQYTIGLPQANSDGQTVIVREEPKACYQTWEMTATVIALAIALFLALFVCVIFIIKFVLNRNRKTIYKDDASCTSSTATFPHLPKLVSDRC